MSSPDSPPPSIFKAKRSLFLTPNAEAENLLSSKTPDKPSQPSLRVRNRGYALSIKEVRRAAESIRDSKRDPPVDGTDLTRSTRKQISRDESLACRSKNAADKSTKLPEKYEMLAEFFDSLDSSFRLLRLKGSATSLTNICQKIECLTDRRFSYGHLAQLKFILPEVIQTKKILVLDERTSCMKPDLHVTLNVDAIVNGGNLKYESRNMHVRKVFRSRLLDFFKAHPEGDEIPEETLPEPFGSKKEMQSNVMIKALNAPLRVETPTADGHSEHEPVSASHLSHSFRTRFSKKIPSLVEKNSRPKLPEMFPHVEAPPVSDIKKVSSCEETADAALPSTINVSSTIVTSKRSLAFEDSPARMPLSGLPATPSKKMDSLESTDFQATPAKFVSPAKFGTVTPQLHPPPKRCSMTPDNDLTSLPNKLVRRTPRTRSLKFDTPKKNESFENDEANEAGVLSIHDDIYDILPENLLQSIEEKETKAMEERDPAISQAKRRRQMIASLPKLFNMIHFLFQSIKRSVITKEELVHKIIAGHCDIVDRREVEEQLELLLELVPEWISEKLASSGDALFRINKMSVPEQIRARLEVAT